MAKIYGVISTKGGVGKTSFCAQFGGILADMKQRVLLVDADFQQSLSRYYRIAQTAPHGLRKLITTADPTGCISRTDIENLDIILSDDPNHKLIEWLRESVHHSFYLTAALKKIKDNYDIIIIDSQGARSIMQESIIFASNELISPIVPKYLDSQEFMRGTVDMMKSLEPADGIGFQMPNIPNLKGLIYKQDRTNDAVAIANALRKKFYNVTDGKIEVLRAFIPELSCYAKAAARRVPVHRIEPKRVGPTPSALETYLETVQELLPHLSDIHPEWSNTAVTKTDTRITATESTVSSVGG